MNPILVAVRLLRGRLMASLILAVVFAIPVAVVVFMLVKPVYTSQGTIQVIPESDPLLEKIPENSPLRDFSGFAATQANFIGSRPVLEKALSDPDLIRTNWPAGSKGIAKLRSELDIERDGQLIHVKLTDPDPEQAKIALDAVLRAYEEMHISKKRRDVMMKEETLEQREKRLEADVRHIQRQIEELTMLYGAEPLKQVHKNRIEQMEKLRESLQEVEREIAEKKSNPTGETTTMVDENMRRMIAHDDQLEALTLQLSSLQQRFVPIQTRWGERHPEYQAMMQRIHLLQNQIRAREKQLEKMAATGKVTGNDDNVDPEQELRQAITLRDQLTQNFQKIQQEVQDLGRRRSQVQQLAYQENELAEDLEETRNRLEGIRLETRNQPGRVAVAVWGTPPTGPSNDKRLPYAGVSGAMAGLFGFMLLPALAMLRREYNYSDETDHLINSQLLGVLPHIDRSNLVSQHRAEIAVQHLRNNLQLITANEHVVVAIGGSEGNEGVTSLVMALAVAMSESGSSVIVVDANLTNPDLTDKMSMSDRYGLREMMTRAEGPDLAQLSRFILGTVYNDVAVLPVGQDMTADPQRLSMVKLRRLMDQLKRRFDVVLIDTGPILGHSHAQLFASVAEQTLLMVRRHQSITSVRDAVNLIRRVSAQTIGLVFNDAAAIDPGLRPIFPKESYLDSLPTSEKFRERSQPSPMMKVKADTDDDNVDGDGNALAPTRTRDWTRL